MLCLVKARMPQVVKEFAIDKLVIVQSTGFRVRVKQY